MISDCHDLDCRYLCWSCTDDSRIIVLLLHLSHLVAIRPQYILLATAKVRVHLAGEQGVFRNVRFAGVFIKRQEEQPCDADDDAKERQVRREPIESSIASNGQQGGYCDW